MLPDLWGSLGGLIPWQVDLGLHLHRDVSHEEALGRGASSQLAQPSSTLVTT